MPAKPGVVAHSQDKRIRLHLVDNAVDVEGVLDENVWETGWVGGWAHSVLNVTSRI